MTALATRPRPRPDATAKARPRVVAGGRDNTFDVLRLIAATMVLFSHSFVLAAVAEPQIGSASVGFFGVEVFFAISGFLVTRSWDHGPHLKAFLFKRALRILPALLACLIASAYVVGTIASTLSPGDYVTSTGPLGYIAHNAVAVATGGTLSGPAYELPGVFAANPHDASVNGSLWTLPIEVQAYFMVALLGVLSLTRRALPAVAAGALLVLAAPATAYGFPVVGPVLEARPEAVQLLAIFGVSGLMYLHRERIPLRLDLALAGLVALFAALGTGAEHVVTTICLPYLVLTAAYRLPKRAGVLTRHGDISYGVYLLAFPVQQSLLALAPGLDHPVALFAASFVPVFALAFASWRLVERPALRFKP
jgi:peptidoglycan/LPS O-acetylase OafA/YrhL